MQLPIDAIEDDIRAALRRTKRLVVTAETGAGKSTRVPVWVADELDGRVLVVEPRRVACQALAGFLASQRGEKRGEYFGSRMRFADDSGPNTRVLFATPGVATQMLADEDPWFDAIVVDEFHERSCDMDLIVTSLCSLKRLRNIPLIVTSATLDAAQVADVIDAETFHTEGRTFPVELEYRGDATGPTTDDLDRRVADAVRHALEHLEGDVLVFLPGMREIRACASAIRTPSHVDVEIVHGSRPPEELGRVLSGSSRRTVYLSTNVAETSVTIPGVRVVIDSGLARTKIHRAGRSALATVPIAADSMEQRMGRAGRVAEGWCVRLWSERFRPAEYSKPEIERVELDDLLLEAAACGLVGTKFDYAKWVTRPPEFAVERARARLGSLEAWDADGKLSEKGRALAGLPMSADEAALLVDPPPKLAGTLCDLVAILQGRGDFMTADDNRYRNARADLLAGVTDDVTESIVIVRDGNPSHHGLSGRRLKEARSVSRQLRGILEIGPNQGNEFDGLAAHILDRLPETGFVLRPRAADAESARRRGSGQPWANGDIEVSVRPYKPLDAHTEPVEPEAAVILETFWLSSGTRVFGIGSMLLPTSRQTLADAGLGEVTIGDIELRKGKRPRVRARRETLLANVVLADDVVPLRGRELCDVVADLTLKNRLFKGAGGRVLDALFLWEILAEWPEPEELGVDVAPPPFETAEELIADTLFTLGVRSNQDLQLVEADDLVPELTDETGVPSFVLDPIIEEFPRVWEHSSARYDVEVEARLRRVTLSPANKVARSQNEPDRKFLPRFRGFNVRYRKASRMIQLR